MQGHGCNWAAVAFPGIVLAYLALGAPTAVAEEEELRDRLGHPIHSLLLDKEVPLLRVRWSGEIALDAPIGDEPPDADFTLRRAKLRFERPIGDKWDLKLTLDYNKGGGFELNDNYVVYTGWTTALLKLGFFDPSFSLEAVGKSASRTFMEEALPVAALAEPRAGGVNALMRTHVGLLDVSLVGWNPQQEGLSTPGQAIVMHYEHAPIDIAGRRDVRLGASFAYRINADDTRFRSRPEIATANTYFVDTDEIDGVDRVVRGGLEANQVLGRFSWQSEVLAASLHRDDAPNLTFWGAYLYSSWFLTEDSRNYDLGQGRFAPPKVSRPAFDGGWGALELAARASFVDLSDRDVTGGRETNLTLGINWYLTEKLRLAGNAVKVLSLRRRGSEYDGTDPLIFAVRFQWLIE